MKHKLIPIIVLILSGLLSWKSITLMLADLHAQSTYHYMDQWEAHGEANSLTHWQIAYQSLLRARELNPHSVNYIITMGKLFEWLSTFATFDSDRQRSLIQAKKYYELAIASRPTWPHTWADKAYTKMLLGENDAQMLLAVGKAINYGPWIKETQKKIFLISFLEWQHLPEPLKETINQQIKAWFHKGNKEMIGFIITKAVQTGRGFLVSTMLNNTNFGENVNKRHIKTFEKAKTSLSRHCNESQCLRYPIKRFNERFEV